MTSATSQNALESAKRRAPRQKDRILHALACFPLSGMTDEELIAFTGLSASTVRPRRGELVAEGLVVDSSRTRKTRSQHEATVWRIATKEEREAFEAAKADRDLAWLAQATEEAHRKWVELHERWRKAIAEGVERQERQREVTP